jgi:hypothetical protein
MRFINKRFLALLVLTFSVDITRAQNQDYDLESKYFTITDVEFREVNEGMFNFSSMNVEVPVEKITDTDPTEPEVGGKIIGMARDLVALGEDLYTLAIKGKPTNTTSYAPISVIPKVKGEPVDLLEMENWSIPTKKTYEVIYRNYFGLEVVNFKYSIIYSYNGTYNGKGAYLTSVQIVPEHVKTLFGFDFSATMKLGGIQNQGKKAYPIAGVTILLQHSVSTIIANSIEVNSFYISGKGVFLKL